MGSADTVIGPGELCLRLTECLTCVSKWEEAVVRHEMREIIHLVSGMMTVDFFKAVSVYCVGLWALCLYCCYKEVHLFARTKL